MAISSACFILCRRLNVVTEKLFFRCLALIARCLQQTQLAAESPTEHDMPDKDFLIVALDLLSGLAEGLSGHIETLVASSHIIALIYQCSLVRNVISDSFSVF